jgi:hypothetical protein
MFAFTHNTGALCGYICVIGLLAHATAAAAAAVIPRLLTRVN